MICYVNGAFVLGEDARISVFDRGFLFSDAVYEVSLVLSGKLVDNRGHLQRLSRSLAKLGIAEPLTHDAIVAIQQQLIEKNQLQDASIYLQISRGSDSKRDFLYADSLSPTVVLIPQVIDVKGNPAAINGISVMSLPEIRWAHRDIKTVSLLGAVMAKSTAKANGFDDAWFIEDGVVTEASSSNACIIKDNAIITKAPNHQILNGITRQSVARLSQTQGLAFIERDFTLEEAKHADEAFVSSATQLVVGVVKIDDTVIGQGQPGVFTKKLRQLYIETALANRLP